LGGLKDYLPFLFFPENLFNLPKRVSDIADRIMKAEVCPSTALWINLQGTMSNVPKLAI